MSPEAPKTSTGPYAVGFRFVPGVSPRKLVLLPGRVFYSAGGRRWATMVEAAAEARKDNENAGPLLRHCVVDTRGGMVADTVTDAFALGESATVIESRKAMSTAKVAPPVAAKPERVPKGGLD